MKAAIITAIAALFILYTNAQKPIEAKVPAWVTTNKIDYTNNSLDKDAEDGYIDLDFEKQVSLADKAVYIRQSFRIISEAGVQNKSQVSVSFDPTYQQLVFHTINIIRGGQVINKLDLAKIKTVHEEDDLEDFIYDGTLNALLVLEDVRKGDILDYSYTLKGFNPVFENKYSTVFGTGYSDPLYNMYFSIKVPAGRSIALQDNNENTQPKIHTDGGQTVYEWSKTLIGPVRAQDHTPDWYDPYPEIRVSEYKICKEINDWALTLFPKPAKLSDGLTKKIKDIQAAYPDDQGRALAALRFVQDDIRYMGIEMGTHSHKPADVDKIFEQRFGDCKEKSYLLCTMLQAMGIQASPVLINADEKQAVLHFLPAVQNFNHVTVRAMVNGTTYWFDPTIAWQRGRLKDISYPDYQGGLVITDTTTTLTTIPANRNGLDDIKEVITIPDMGGAAHLTVTTTYTGDFADAQRDDFKNNSNYDILQKLQKFYAYYFEKITADSLNYTDDDSTGVFVRRAYFTIKDIWTDEKGVKKGEFYPFIIGSLIKKPDDKVRTMPYGINFPARYHEVVEINLPEEWPTDIAPIDVSCEAFKLSMRFSQSQKQIRLVYDYEALKDHVQPDEVDKYLAAVNKAEASDQLNLTYGKNNNGEEGNKTSASNIVFVVLAVILLVGGIIWWSQRA